MKTHRILLVFPLLAILATTTFAAQGVTPAAARALANGWIEGSIAYTHDASALDGSTELGTGNFVSFLATPAPTVGTPYYLAITMTGIGDPVAGGSVSSVDFQLPSNTTLASSASYPFECQYDGANCAGTDAAQPLQASTRLPGGWQILRVLGAQYAPLWPIVQGHTTEFHIPVVSSAPLSGSTFLAQIQAIDGTYNETVQPTVGVIVGGVAAPPSISYANPSTTSITNTSGHSVGTITLNSLGGAYTFELGPTTAYGLIQEGANLASGNSSVQVYDDWGPPALLPGTLYHWRLSFTPTGGTVVQGADQTFTTTGGTTALEARARRLAGLSRPAVDLLGRLRGPSTGSGLEIPTAPSTISNQKSLQLR